MKALALTTVLSLVQLTAWAPVILYGIITIQPVTMSATVIEAQPAAGDTNYFTLTGTSAFSGILTNELVIFTGFASNTSATQLSWLGHSNEAYVVQYSTNQTDWQDVQVRIIGNGSTSFWYDLPSSRSYRLNSPNILPPGSLRVVSQ